MTSFFSFGAAEKLACAIPTPDKKRRNHHQQQQQQQPQSHFVSRTSGVVEVPTMLDDVLYQLKNNEMIELRLGWNDTSGFVTSGRHLSALAKALKGNTSLRRVSIGWHWKRQQRDLLFQLLIVLADSIRPQQLQSIQLVLNDSVPASVLARFLQSQTSLSSLDLRAVTMQYLPWKGLASDSNRSNASADGVSTSRSALSESYINNSIPTKRFGKRSVKRSLSYDSPKKHHGLENSTAYAGEVTTVVPLLLEAFFANHRFEVVSEMRLVDCDLDDDAAVRLAQHILPTSLLSVRGNRRITGRGAAALIQEAGSKSLDLSLCDLQMLDFVGPIATALENRRRSGVPLEELGLAGNYRMELAGLKCLWEVCPFVVRSLDLSHCDLSETMTVHTMQALIGLGQKQIYGTHEQVVQDVVVLRQLTMHGCRIGSHDAAQSLVALLRQNAPPLHTLAVEDDKNDRKYIALQYMRQIAEAMQHNYEMENLTFDYYKNKNEQHAWKEIEYWQRLNRAGRRLLRPATSESLESSPPSFEASTLAKAQRADLDEWIKLLTAAQAETGLESIYWVVQNSTERFAIKR